MYVQHYNGRRPHRALDLEPSDPTPAVALPCGDPPAPLITLRRRDPLGGLIHEYQLAAWTEFLHPTRVKRSREFNERKAAELEAELAERAGARNPEMSDPAVRRSAAIALSTDQAKGERG
jgi:hypothetical protein